MSHTQMYRDSPRPGPTDPGQTPSKPPQPVARDIGKGKRDRSPALTERLLNASLPPRILSTPGSVRRNNIRRRLRSPAMMSSPFKSSIKHGNTPSRGTPVGRACVCTLEGTSDLADVSDGISSLFVSPSPTRPEVERAGKNLGSPLPPPLLPPPPPSISTKMPASTAHSPAETVRSTHTQRVESTPSPWKGNHYAANVQVSPSTPCEEDVEQVSWPYGEDPSIAMATTLLTPLGTPLGITVIEEKEEGELDETEEVSKPDAEDDSDADEDGGGGDGDGDGEGGDDGDGAIVNDDGREEEEEEEEEDYDEKLPFVNQDQHDNKMEERPGQEGSVDWRAAEVERERQGEGEDETRLGKVKPPNRPGWDVAWSQSSQDWYWWNKETRESTWLDPLKRRVVLRKPYAGKRLAVNVLKILSEDGGYSAVKEVADDKGRHYALKAMQKTDVHWENVTNEKKVMLELQMQDHPFLVGLLATGSDQESLYMLLELCTGGDLFSRLEDVERFDDNDTRFYISQVLLGLQTLHRGSTNGPFAGMDFYIHRDIKPENVLLGADGYALLADFGFTCRLVHNQRTYSQVGTAEYMAPELILSKGYDQCADYWSIGILIYELLIGCTPFADDENERQQGKHSRLLAYVDGADLHWPSSVEISPEAKRVISGLLTPCPKDRLGMAAATPAGGCAEIMRHEWFQGTDWLGLKQKQLPPPWAPRVDLELTSASVPSTTTASTSMAPRIRVVCGDVETAAREYRSSTETDDNSESDEVDSDDEYADF